MVAKHFTEKPFDEATLTKLDIFESYLKGWLPVFLQSGYHQQLTICDFFAGSGKDAAGNPGSALRILLALDKFRDLITQTRTLVRVVLNDLTKHSELEDMAAAKVKELELPENFIQVECHGKPFRALFDTIYDSLSRQPNLIFIDQCGVTEVDEAIFLKLVALKKTDFLFFMSSSFLRRFAEHEYFETFLKGLDRNELKDAKPEHVHRIVIKHISTWIPKGNEIKIYPFSLKKDKDRGSNIYGLVFGSKHPLGVEKFLKIAWNKNKINGEANYAIDKEAENPQMKLFSIDMQQTKIEVFEKELQDFILAKNSVTNRQLYDFTLENGHIPAHARDVIKKMRKEGLIQWDSVIGISYDACCSKKSSIKTIKVVKNGKYKD